VKSILGEFSSGLSIWPKVLSHVWRPLFTRGFRSGVRETLPPVLTASVSLLTTLITTSPVASIQSFYIHIRQ